MLFAQQYPRRSTTATTLRALLVLLGLCAATKVSAAAPPPLFLYPLPYRFADGHVLGSPQTMAAAQITGGVPAVPQASGVVLMVYWSTLCPRQGGCDFGLIDDTLRYWRQRHRRVVLDVATEGFPMSTPAGMQGATPGWALAKIRTYVLPTRLLGQGSPQVRATMPDFTDDRYVTEVAGLVRLLRRYDGNPAISQIRVGTGLMGEDNPLIGPVMAPVAGFTEQAWLAYTRRVAALYFAAFRRTELEFDIGRLSWLAARGSAADKEAVDQFVTQLLRHRVLLAFDGLGLECLRQIEHPDPRNGIGQSLRYLQNYRSRGGRIGLEAIGHAAAPQMRDVQAVAQVVRRIEPDRLVLFTDAEGGRKQLDRLLAALGYR